MRKCIFRFKWMEQADLGDLPPLQSWRRVCGIAGIGCVGLSLVLVLTVGTSPTNAQSQDVSQKAATSSAKRTAPYKLPHINVMTKLIQSHMAALGNAIITNNFTVLRDLGTPEFKNKNSAVQLKAAFAPFRKRALDLTTVVLFAPAVRHTPKVDATGQLKLRGYYATKPKRVHFDLVFMPASGKWRLHAIHVNVAPTPKRVSRNAETDERTIVSRVNMRDKPSLSGKLLATLSPGQKIKVLGKSPSSPWHKVALGPKAFGYIKTSVLMANSK